MHADSYYEIGAGHLICQDYALHGVVGDFHYIMGADGCSSSKKSHLGAALMCEAARKILEVNGGQMALNAFQSFLLSEMRQLKTFLSLQGFNFDATFWLVLATGGYYHIYGWGDGAIRVVNKDGTTKTTHIEFTSGAPCYLSYALEPSRYELYKEQTKDTKVVIRMFENENLIDTKETEPASFQFIGGGRTDGVKSISIFSDGVNTYKDKDGEEMHDFKGVLDKLTDYKGFQGVFVERMMKSLDRANKKNNVLHYDDVFCGTISV